MRPWGLGKVDSPIEEVERGLLVLAQGALAWETGRTKGDISRSGKKDSEAQRPGPLQVPVRDPTVAASPGKGPEAAASSSPICVCPQDQPQHRGGANVS